MICLEIDGERGKTHGWTLNQLVGCHHLHIEVFSLRLPPGFDESLENLRGETQHSVAQDDTHAHKLLQLYPDYEEEKNKQTIYHEDHFFSNPIAQQSVAVM